MAQNTKNINKRRNSVAKEKNHHFFLFFVLFLIVCAVVVLCLIFFKPLSNKNNDGKTAETSKTTEDKAEKKAEQPETKEEETKKESIRETEKSNPQYEGEDPNSYETLSGIINYVGLSDGNIVVSVAIDQAVSGSCNFTLTTPSGKTISGAGELTPGPATSFCELSTPASENGTWKISVETISSSKRGTLTSEAKI